MLSKQSEYLHYLLIPSQKGWAISVINFCIVFGPIFKTKLILVACIFLLLNLPYNSPVGDFEFETDWTLSDDFVLTRPNALAF